MRPALSQDLRKDRDLSQFKLDFEPTRGKVISLSGRFGNNVEENNAKKIQDDMLEIDQIISEMSNLELKYGSYKEVSEFLNKHISALNSLKSMVNDNSNIQSGPYKSFEKLAQNFYLAVENPSNMSRFVNSLSAGINITAITSHIVEETNFWRIQLVYAPSSDYSRGFFCKINKSDKESIRTLSQIQPYGTRFRVNAAYSEDNKNYNETEYVIIFAPCAISIEE